MYAIIKSGGKQYQVSVGKVLKLEKLAADPGHTINFDDVLMVAEGDNIQIGSPFLEGAKVSAKVIDHSRAKKIEILKFKRRKHHMKRIGHRQHFTQVEITDITI